MINNWDDFLFWEQRSDDTIDFKKVYVDMVGGDVVIGLCLAQLVYWHLPSKKTGKSKMKVRKHGKVWVVKADNEWYAETRLSAAQARRSREHLQKNGIIEMATHRYYGVPKIHLRIVHNVFLQLLKACEAKIRLEMKAQNDDDFDDYEESDLSQNTSQTCHPEHVDLSHSTHRLASQDKYLTKTTTETNTKTTTEKASTKVEALSGKNKQLTLSGKKSSKVNKVDRVVSGRVSYQTGTKAAMAEDKAQRAGLKEKFEEARALQREHAKGDQHYATWIQVRDVIQQDAPVEAKRWSKLLAVYDAKARNAIEVLFEDGIDPLKYAAWYVNHHKTSKWLQSKNLPFSWGLFGSQIKYFVEENAAKSGNSKSGSGTQSLMDSVRSKLLSSRQSA